MICSQQASGDNAKYVKLNTSSLDTDSHMKTCPVGNANLRVIIGLVKVIFRKKKIMVLSIFSEFCYSVINGYLKKNQTVYEYYQINTFYFRHSSIKVSNRALKIGLL